MEVKLKFKSGKEVEGQVLAKTWAVAVLKTKEGKYILVSKYALKNPEDLKFKDDFAEAKEDKEENEG